ncbi:MAG: aminodeoxychorismate lyase [Candidatus Berkiella sp.]
MEHWYSDAFSFLANGEIDRIQSNSLFYDRGLHYGDGVFETITIRNIDFLQQHPFYNYHLQRLKLGLEKLFFPDIDFEVLLNEVNAFIAKANRIQAIWVLKLIITRGQGARGYRPHDYSQPNVILLQRNYPIYPETFSTDGIDVEWSNIVLPIDPQLAGIKHLNRLSQVLASIGASSTCQEVLLCNARGNVIEGSKSNIFVVINDQVFTPCLKDSGVRGVMRAYLLNCLKTKGYFVEERLLFASDLAKAEEIFVCNSIIGIWPIRRLLHQTYRVGSLTKMLQTTLKQETYFAT